ncbi:unnamed protein product [Amoebophrya sp. A120]|nr:unnamed protein product [Amoebophrya sp. A120]|eukprot:GSA120T00010930001.1
MPIPHGLESPAADADLDAARSSNDVDGTRKTTLENSLSRSAACYAGHWDEQYLSAAHKRTDFEWHLTCDKVLEVVQKYYCYVDVAPTQETGGTATEIQGRSSIVTTVHSARPEDSAPPTRPPTHCVIDVGCGSSTLGLELARRVPLASGFAEVHLVDVSPVIYDTIKAKLEEETAGNERENLRQTVVRERSAMSLDDSDEIKAVTSSRKYDKTVYYLPPRIKEQHQAGSDNWVVVEPHLGDARVMRDAFLNSSKRTSNGDNFPAIMTTVLDKGTLDALDNDGDREQMLDQCLSLLHPGSQAVFVSVSFAAAQRVQFLDRLFGVEVETSRTEISPMSNKSHSHLRSTVSKAKGNTKYGDSHFCHTYVSAARGERDLRFVTVIGRRDGSAAKVEYDPDAATGELLHRIRETGSILEDDPAEDGAEDFCISFGN